MSSRQRHSLFGRRLGPIALAGAVLAVAAAGPGTALAATPGKAHAAQQNPDQVIDANANPDGAADALNSGCANTSNCKWSNDTGFISDYGPPSMLGDVLYNCSTDSYAETTVNVENERQQSTSISERVSLKVSLSFLGFAKASAEFLAFSSQSSSFSTSVKVSNAVAVPPGYKGWTVTEILSANVTGSAYITDGVKLIQVKNIDLSFPGYQDPDTSGDSPVIYTGVKTPMDADDIKAACAGTTGTTAALLRMVRTPSKFKLGLCRRYGRCTSRKVAGSPPRGVRPATARLTRAGRTYGQGTYSRGRTRLQMRRPLRAGSYKLTLTERPAASRQIGAGPLHAIKTIVPVTVG